MIAVRIAASGADLALATGPAVRRRADRSPDAGLNLRMVDRALGYVERNVSISIFAALPL
jgi:hypothetical protein